MKYRSAIILQKRDDLKSERDFDNLKTVTTRILLTQLPEKIFVCELKYVYQTPNSMTTKIIYPDWRKTIERKDNRKNTIMEQLRLLGL